MLSILTIAGGWARAEEEKEAIAVVLNLRGKKFSTCFAREKK